MRSGAAVLGALLALCEGCAAGVSRGPTKATSPPEVRATGPEGASGVTWMRPIAADLPGTGYWLYFGVDREQRVTALRAVFEAWLDRGMLADRVLVEVDGAVEEVAIAESEWRRGLVRSGEPGSPGLRWEERADVPLGTTQPDLVARICAARSLTVRIAGRAGVTVEAQGPALAESARRVCAAHRERVAATAAGP